MIEFVSLLVIISSASSFLVRTYYPWWNM